MKKNYKPRRLCTCAFKMGLANIGEDDFYEWLNKVYPNEYYMEFPIKGKEKP